MKKHLVITDLTQMSKDNVCIAGYLQDGTCVRPIIGEHLTKEYLKENTRTIIRPFSIIDLDFIEPDERSCPPHTEDWLVSPNYFISLGLLNLDQKRSFLLRINDQSVDRIFGAILHESTGWTKGWYVARGEGMRSLGTIAHPEIVGAYFGSQFGGLDYRLIFKDANKALYRLPITDLTFRYYLDHLCYRENMNHNEAAQSVARDLQNSEVILRIGLARRWQKYPDRCYLQVTGIYSFPDYLSGRMWADLELSAEELERRKSLTKEAR